MRAKTNSQIGGMSVSDAREQPAAQPQKKRMSRGTRVLVIIVCVLLAIALILVATVLILSAVGRNALTNDDGVNIARDDVEALGSGTVRYNGQLYRYNTDIVTILLMGVDEEVKQDTGGVYGNANQSDANILAVLDMRNQELTLVSISRDAMCTLDILDSTGAAGAGLFLRRRSRAQLRADERGRLAPVL